MRQTTDKISYRQTDKLTFQSQNIIFSLLDRNLTTAHTKIRTWRFQWKRRFQTKFGQKTNHSLATGNGGKSKEATRACWDMVQTK